MSEIRSCAECGFVGRYDTSAKRADYYFRRHRCGHGRAGYDRGCRCDRCRAGHAAKNAQWRVDNPERAKVYSRERSRIYRERNPEDDRASKQRWVDQNPDVRREVAAKYASKWYSFNSDRAKAYARQYMTPERRALNKERRQAIDAELRGPAVRKRWTPEEDALVTSLVSMVELAVILGRTPGSVSQRRHILRSHANQEARP